MGNGKLLLTLLPMSKTISKQDILGALVGEYYDDLEFIEAVNNLTYGRKVQLKANLKANNEKSN